LKEKIIIIIISCEDEGPLAASLCSILIRNDG